MRDIWPWAGLAVLLACWVAAVRAVRTARAVMPPAPTPEPYRLFAIPMVALTPGERQDVPDGRTEWWTPTLDPKREGTGVYDALRAEAYLEAIEPGLPKLAHQGSRKA